MVREIVHVQVGQCGNQVGYAFWETVCAEHKIQPNGSYWAEQPGCGGDKDGDGTADELENIEVYYQNTKPDLTLDKGKYVPRCCAVDLEPGTGDVMKQARYGALFHDDNNKYGANGAGNNWAKGHYTEGAELVDDCMDIIRRLIEASECPQGFQLFHSLGGGTGSGLGTLLLLKIRDAYPDKITTTYSVYPSPKVSDTVVEPYNAVLSSHQLLENSDETFIVDNEALYNISHNVLKQKQPEYSDLNSLVGLATCGITASLRFPGQLNGDLRKLGVNLVPFPRLHFFLVSQAPILNKENSSKVQINVKELISQGSSARNFYSNVKPDDGKYLAVSYMFRGELSTSDIDKEMKAHQTKAAENFVEWIPNNLKTGQVEIKQVTSTKWVDGLISDATLNDSCTVVANTTALKGIFQRLATQFGAMYRRKAFLHWYKGEGMDEMEFQEADKNVRDLITEYQDKQDAVVESEGDDGDVDDDSLN